ncbi:DUF7674 family protein [Flavobacterium silvaticum]|uniref:DUF7674 domain-containing protein n=1 Tax=Flavobacterium silvaticum TaxID=1852020 RepID=A0A972FN61_9FLAO|nr:hypothetical protein [Flavobacterium silvaticum]NMH28772.1 hypothetical protein [Flavobacterium silvaticum]
MKNTIISIQGKASRLAEITKTCLRTGNIVRARKCLLAAEELLKNGSLETKVAITNVYVFSVSGFMELRNCRISGLFPPLLHAEYISQINATSV